jgi:hypothetical protein
MVRLRDIQPITEEKCPVDVQSNEVNDVPLIHFNSKLDGLDEKVMEIKLRKYSNDFKQSLNQVLVLYPIDKLKYSSHLVSFVMHEAERFLLKPKSGGAKRQLVIDCVKKYFDDNDQMVGVVIDLLFKDLKQVKFIGRQAMKLMRFFFNRKQSQ